MRRKSLSVRLVFVCLFSLILSAAAFGQADDLSEGSLRVIGADGKPQGLAPLTNTDVRAEVAGLFTRVTVTQTFQNPFDRPIEAVYNFPLPNDAAVDDMTIQIGDRLIRGAIMERQKAQAAYDAAKQQGKTAALLEQQRPNIFTQSVANITPGAEIKVMISYVETLNYVDDTYEFTFPMTIGERYIPSGADAADAAKITSKVKARPGHTVSMELRIDAGVPVQGVASNTHEIEFQQYSPSQYVVRLKNSEEIPNRDFKLNYRTAGQKIDDTVLAHKSGEDGFFTFILQPPDRVMPADTMPKEIVFVMDTSGSMDGFPINKAKEAMNLTLDNLNPNDTFNLITFAGETRILFPVPVQATKENLKKARKALSDSDSGGGTEMMDAIKASLEASDSQNHLRIVCFMTDGQVGNEAQIIAEVKKHPNARVFAFGIGDSVNRYLLDEISREGRGEAQYVGRNDNGSAAARKFFERIRNPLMTDIKVEVEGIESSNLYPQEIPDLFDAKPVHIVGRYANGGSGKIVLRGRMQGQEFTREIPLSLPNESPQNDSIRSIWARQRVAELSSQMLNNEVKEPLEAEITRLGLAYRIMTQYTSFVAVDQNIVTDGSPPAKVEVPNAAVNNIPNVSATPIDPNANGGVSATVTVTADGTLNSSGSAISTTVETQVLQNLPLNGRSFQSLLVLTPGTTVTTPVNPGEFSVNGNRSNTNYMTIDGISANAGIQPNQSSPANSDGPSGKFTAVGGTNGMVSVDALQEFKVQTSGASAEFGRTSGSQIQVVTRGGTNSFHGSAFETFGNEAMNANDTFANERGFDRAPARLNQFGGTFSGPIRRDKIFFFGNYEGLRLRQPAFGLSEVPNAATRENASSETAFLFSAFPLPNGRETAFGLAEFAASFANPAAHDIFGFRLDWNPFSKLTLFGRYNLSDSHASVRGDGDTSLNTLRRTGITTHSATFGATYLASSTVSIDGRFGFSDNRTGQRYSRDRSGGAAPPFPIPSQIPIDLFSFSLAGRNSTLNFGGGALTDTDQMTAVTNVHWVKGSHDLAFGGEYRRTAFAVDADQAERTVRLFGAPTAGPASFVDEIVRFGEADSSYTNLSLFAEDEWKLNKRLNFNLSVRWDADVAPKLRRTDSPVAGYSNAMPSSIWNFSPRAALAWDVLGKGKTMVRVGAGLYVDQTNSSSTESFTNSYPFVSGRYSCDTEINGPATEPVRPYILFADDLILPKTWKIYAEFQQELATRTVLSATYSGAFGRDLLRPRTELRADGGILNGLRKIDNSGSSDHHAGEVRVEQRMNAGLASFARYTFAKSIDDLVHSGFRQWEFADANAGGDRGPSDSDVRHSMSFYGSYNIPKLSSSGWRERVFDRWTLFGSVNVRTALPVNMTYAVAENFGSALYRLNQATVASPYTMVNGRRGIDPAAFGVPVIGANGSIGRNSLRGFSFTQINMGLGKRVDLPREMQLNLKAEVFNVLNATNLGEVDGRLGTLYPNDGFLPNQYFGQAVSTLGSRDFSPFYFYGGPRTVQLTAKFTF